MLNRKRPDVDIVNNVLEAAKIAYPNSAFIQSLWLQYHERGGLSRKQLEGLYGKASKIKTIPVKWLATIEAEILKKPARFKSAPPTTKPLYSKDERIGKMISSILEKYPGHKRVIFLNGKYNHDEPFTPAEIGELERFYKLLVSK